MSHELMREADWTWPSTGVPGAAWALGVAAVLALGIATVMRGFFGSSWYFDWSLVGDAVPSALPFAMAAAVVAGAFRWPATRPWLLIAAGLLALHGLLDLAMDVWLAWWLNFSADPSQSLPEGATFARALISQLALVGAFALLAAALWGGGRGRMPRAGWRWVAILGVGIVGAIGVGGAIASGALEVGITVSRAPGMTLYSTSYYAVSALQLVAATLLAIAALASMPERHRLPEILIAAAAMAYVVATGALSWLFATVPSASVSPELALLLSQSRMAGLIGLAVGFATTRLFPAPPHRLQRSVEARGTVA